jgi:hypothetical protein
MAKAIKTKKTQITGFPKPVGSLVRKFNIVDRSVEDSRMPIRYSPQNEAELAKREVVDEGYESTSIKDAYNALITDVVIRTHEFVAAKVCFIVHLNGTLKIKPGDSDLANPDNELFFMVRLWREDGSSELVVTDNKIFYNCAPNGPTLVELRDQGVNKRYLRERGLIEAAINNYLRLVNIRADEVNAEGRNGG